MKQSCIGTTLAGLWLSVSLAACGYYHEVTEVGPAPGAIDTSATLGFEVVQSILARNRCLDCHTAASGNRGGVNLESYSVVAAQASMIVSAIESGFMPIGGPSVPDSEQLILRAWLEAGSPEFSQLPLPGAEDPVGEVPAPQIGFAQVRDQIFVPHCVGCHAGFATYARVSSRLGEIQDAIDSGAMPKDAAPLSQELKSLLASWIAAGAPEN